MTADAKKVKSQLLKVIAEERKLSTTLNTVEKESDMMLEQLTVVQDACDLVEELEPSIVGQSVEDLDAFINQVELS